MPGHMKQTREMMISCTGGEANHGSVNPKMRSCLYFQESGSSSVPVGSERECSGVVTSCGGRAPLSSAMMEDADRRIMGGDVLNRMRMVQIDGHTCKRWCW
jgi:hypothetical protein